MHLKYRLNYCSKIALCSKDPKIFHQGNEMKLFKIIAIYAAFVSNFSMAAIIEITAYGTFDFGLITDQNASRVDRITGFDIESKFYLSIPDIPSNFVRYTDLGADGERRWIQSGNIDAGEFLFSKFTITDNSMGSPIVIDSFSDRDFYIQGQTRRDQDSIQYQNNYFTNGDFASYLSRFEYRFSGLDSPFSLFSHSVNFRTWEDSPIFKSVNFDQIYSWNRKSSNNLCGNGNGDCGQGRIQIETGTGNGIEGLYIRGEYSITSLQAKLASVPEPATLSFLALGFVGLVLRRRWRA